MQEQFLWAFTSVVSNQLFNINFHFLNWQNEEKWHKKGVSLWNKSLELKCLLLASICQLYSHTMFGNKNGLIYWKAFEEEKYLLQLAELLTVRGDWFPCWMATYPSLCGFFGNAGIAFMGTQRTCYKYDMIFFICVSNIEVFLQLILLSIVTCWCLGSGTNSE